MENSASLEELRDLTAHFETDRVDRNVTELAQQVLAVLDWFEARLDCLDKEEGV